MKYSLFLFGLLFTLSVAKGQKKQNVYFLKNNGVFVTTKDSADFVRIIQEPDSGETNFIFQEFFPDGKRKMVGKVSAFEPILVHEGSLIAFSKTGRRLSITNYEKGRAIGMGYQYFENGKLYKQIEHVRVPINTIQAINFSTAIEDEFSSTGNKLIYMADSAGVAVVQDGNGHAIEASVIDKNERTEEGDYKDGFKQGIWKGTESATGLTFSEVYEAGKLVSGESVLAGKKYTYKAKFEMAQFRGGPPAWASYMKNEIRYPNDALKNNIMGAVNTSFTIDKDGRIIDVNITRPVYTSLDEEARRVLSRSPLWVPAKMRGVPVKVKYTQAFNFRF